MNFMILCIFVAIAVASPCGVDYPVQVSPSAPTILGSWPIQGSVLNLTCAYASFPSAALSMMELGILCSMGTAGPFFSFPPVQYSDYFSGSAVFQCPFTSATFSTVAYNPYSVSVSVSSVATAVINGQLAHSVAAPSVPHAHGITAAVPSVCSSLPYNGTVAGSSSSRLLYWTSPMTTLTLACFGLYSYAPSHLDLAIACSQDSTFTNTVVPLADLPQWLPSASVDLTCPFYGYFGIIARNRAKTTVSVSFAAQALSAPRVEAKVSQ